MNAQDKEKEYGASDESEKSLHIEIPLATGMPCTVPDPDSSKRPK